MNGVNRAYDRTPVCYEGRGQGSENTTISLYPSFVVVSVTAVVGDGGGDGDCLETQLNPSSVQ